MYARLVRALLSVAIVLLMMVAPSPTLVATEPGSAVLVVTATAGFYHDSIPTAREVVAQLAGELGLDVTFVNSAEVLRALPPEAFGSYAVVAFVNTTGELPLSPAQKEALLAFVAR